MNEQMMTATENTQPLFVIKLKDGTEISARYSERILAEQHLLNLPEDLQRECSIVPVTKDGKELLFG